MVTSMLFTVMTLPLAHCPVEFVLIQVVITLILGDQQHPKLGVFVLDLFSQRNFGTGNHSLYLIIHMSKYCSTKGDEGNPQNTFPPRY